MKKIFVFILLLILVATMVSAVELFNSRLLRKAVEPYVEQWGPYDGYFIMSHPIQGTAAGFSWIDEFGEVLHYVIFGYIDGEWLLYETSKEFVEMP